MFLGGLVVWAGLRQPLPPNPSATTGLPALAYTGLSLAVWVLLVLLGVALGKRVLRMLRLTGYAPAEAWIWALPTGLTLLGYPVYALGMLGLFRREALALLFLALTLALRQEVHAALREGSALLRAAGRGWRKAPRVAQVGWGLMAFLMTGAFLLALTPPTEYDVLWYHLQAPRLFLQAGRIYPEWNNWPANYAFAVNMLYALPMALGTDSAPKLLHWTFALALLLVTYHLARPYAGKWAWIAPGFVLLPSFVVHLYPSALVDAAMGVLELLAFGALMRAVEARNPSWFRAAGFWAGLSLSVKLASLPVLLVGALFWLLWGFPNTLLARVKTLIAFILSGLGMAMPWYLKNALWFGTPLFPVALPSPDQAIRLRSYLLSAYTNRDVHGFRRLGFLIWLLVSPLRLDYLGSVGELPFLVGTFGLPISPPVAYVLTLLLLRLAFWVMGPPMIRFLLAVFALAGIALAILITNGFASPSTRTQRIARLLLSGHMVVLVLIGMRTGLFLRIQRPWLPALGIESQRDYLERTMDGYRGFQFLRKQKRGGVLLIGDARHYYCPSVCDPEADQFTWTRIAMQAEFDVPAVLRELQRRGITHLWLHKSSMRWLVAHDVQGWVKRSYTFLNTRVLPQCGSLVYEDEDVTIVALPCLQAP